MLFRSALNIVRERQPAVPVVMISGALAEGEGYKAMMDGAQDYLPKHNLNTDVLNHIVQRVAAVGRQ